MSERMNEEFMSSLEAFKEFFDTSKKAFGQKDSESYTRVKEQFMNSYNTIAALQDQTVTQENSIQMYEARKALAEICESYVKENENRRIYTGTGQKRLNTIKDVLGHLKKDDFSQLRDPKAVEQHAGKKWSEVKEMPTARVEIDGFGQNVGDLGSNRYIINYNEKKGLFTPRTVVDYRDNTIGRYIDGEERPDYKRILNNNREHIIENVQFMGNTAAVVDKNVFFKITKDNIRTLELLKVWDNMPEKTPEQSTKKSDVMGLFLNLKTIDAFNNVINDYKNELGNLSEADKENQNKKRALFDACVEKVVDEKPKGAIRKCSAMLYEFAENEKQITEPLSTREAQAVEFEKNSYIKLGAAVIKKNKEMYNQTKELLNNRELFLDVVNHMDEAVKLEKPLDGMLGELKPGSELSGRNAASSRLAEAFGVGNLLAHSQDMVANIGGKEVQGNFMEFVEDGIDVRNCKGKDLERLSKIELTNTPELTKDMCNLEMLDYICAQVDRHGGNLFLKLDENNRPIGIKGIDNDLCLSDYSKERPGEPLPMKQGQLKDLHFMSKSMADKIQNITPDDLKWMVGDKISENELEALQGRIENVKNHIKNNVFLVENDEDWSLKDYDKLIKPENLRGKEKENEAKALFEKAVYELEDGLNLEGKKDNTRIHQNSNLAEEIEKAKKRYQKEAEKGSLEPEKEAPEKEAPEKEAPQTEKQSSAAEMKDQGMTDKRSKDMPAKGDKPGNGAERTNLNDLTEQEKKQNQEKEQNQQKEPSKIQGLMDTRSKAEVFKKQKSVIDHSLKEEVKGKSSWVKGQVNKKDRGVEHAQPKKDMLGGARKK